MYLLNPKYPQTRLEPKLRINSLLRKSNYLLELYGTRINYHMLIAVVKYQQIVDGLTHTFQYLEITGPHQHYVIAVISDHGN